MTRMLGMLVTALLAWCGVMQPAQASVPTPVVAVTTYAYDACHHAAVPTCTTTERGPPTEPYRDIANPAVGHWPNGALARSARTATSIAYTYDPLAPLGKAARDAGTTRKQVQGERVALSARGESRVAAKSADTVVLGHYPEYVDLAKATGGRTFQIPTKIWDSMSPTEQWAANQKFLDRAIARGSNIRLATPANAAREGSYFERELQYIQSRGYTVGPDGMSLIAPGGP